MFGKPLQIAILIFAGLVIIILSRVAVKTVFFSAPSQAAEEHEVVKVVKKEKHETGGGSHGGEEGELNEGIYMIENLIINPANSGGRRHLFMDIGLKYNETTVKHELEQLDPQIRDNLITILAGQEMSVLSEISYREKIRETLIKAVNYHLKTGKVEKLFFVRYVFQ